MKTSESINILQKISLIFGSFLVLLVAILHVYIALRGGDLYIYYGAGEDMARMDKAGSLYPMISTLVLATLFLGCAFYGLSAAAVLPKLPSIRLIIWFIAGVFTLRGLFIFYHLSPWNTFPPRYIVFSLYALLIGLCFLIPVLLSSAESRNRDFSFR